MQQTRLASAKSRGFSSRRASAGRRSPRTGAGSRRNSSTPTTTCTGSSNPGHPGSAPA